MRLGLWEFAWVFVNTDNEVCIMAISSVWSMVSCKSHAHPTIQSIRQIEREKTEFSLPSRDCRCLSPSLICEMDRKWNASHHGSDFFPKARGRQVFWLVYDRSSLPRKIGGIPLLDVYKTEGHERSCDNGAGAKEYRMESSSQFEGQHTDSYTASKPCKRQTTLDSLENYFGELNTVQDLRKATSLSPDKENLEGHPIQRPGIAIGGYNDDTMIVKPNSFERLKKMKDEVGYMSSGNENMNGLQTDDRASDFYLINLPVAINIAVFLFEIASPIRSSDVENLSLPLAYGAKINKLILVGEWWRLLTPMFLHSGFLHVALSCWVLLTFGPQVCRGYGPFTFLLIYILGGICGNLTSFIHTPELTVCGTGPVFAIIGAWLVYQIQNKQVITKELSESLFWKAVTATALSFVLSNFGRIDDWAHLGATFSGIIFGYLTCPALQMLDNTLSSKDGQKQNFALIRRQADPCKSLLIFTVSIFTMSCLVFFYVPQLQLLEMEDLS